MKKQVVVRFAPSPTGYLHIGGARTAIFNWLYARKTGGKFILRIEDTDAERSTENSIEGIIEGLKWLGLLWDEGPNFQSQHIEEHQRAAQKLLETGYAYKCFCTKEDIETKREDALKSKTTYSYDRTCRNLTCDQTAKKEADGLPYAIRLKVPDGPGSVVFNDAVYGTIEKKYADMEDFIIVRSNGKPLYVLSNAVDDIRDKVTHIIRGQDGLANTPKQILLYNALGATLPVFAHMSLTLDPKKAKISKRNHGELVAVHFYRQNGFLPWALVNFLVLLGWATTESKEIFSKEELIEAFSLEGISRANSVFNINKDDPKYFTDPKAINVNAHYLRTIPVEELLPYVKKQLEGGSLWNDEFETNRKKEFIDIIGLVRSRFHLLTDFTTTGRAYFSDDYPINADALKKNILKHPELINWLSNLADRINTIENFNAKTIEKVIMDMAGDIGTKPGILVNGIRIAVTGQAVGPDFIKSLITIGQNKVTERLAKSPLLFEDAIS
ncbi:MAG: glutamate--tRNA ligase [Proteobacteria bacterium]|nr:glutamate--tRNA ligase [Pseudomonadota bacterium]